MMDNIIKWFSIVLVLSVGFSWPLVGFEVIHPKWSLILLASGGSVLASLLIYKFTDTR